MCVERPHDVWVLSQDRNELVPPSLTGDRAKVKSCIPVTELLFCLEPVSGPKIHALCVCVCVCVRPVGPYIIWDDSQRRLLAQLGGTVELLLEEVCLE